MQHANWLLNFSDRKARFDPKCPSHQRQLPRRRSSVGDGDGVVEAASDIDDATMAGASVESCQLGS